MQAGGQEFDSPHLHHVATNFVGLFCRKRQKRTYYVVAPFPHETGFAGAPKELVKIVSYYRGVT